MLAIDIHAHMHPRKVLQAATTGKDWYGARLETDEHGRKFLVSEGVRTGPHPEKIEWTPERRLEEMDSIKVDMHVLSLAPPLYNYHLPENAGVSAAGEVNDEIAEMFRQWPQRFKGLATLPLPHTSAAVRELERAMTLGFKGVQVNTHVLGRNWDEPEFAPIFQAAEDTGAVLFFHPSVSLVHQRINRYHLANTIGNPLEDALVIGVIIYSGILDRHPNLKLVVAHGGGPMAFGIDRLDRSWAILRQGHRHIPQPPSSYLRRFHVDCITWGEASLRFLIDRLGADRVVLGSDWPYDMGPESPVEWLQGMRSISDEAKELILHKNLERLLEL